MLYVASSEEDRVDWYVSASKINVPQSYQSS
jgi:hypothetical protein